MLVPSIDLMNGKAVQLRQGKELVLESERDPIDLAREFNKYGEVAVIDLDAAMGKGNNRELVREICKVADARVGGGIRDVETGRELLKAGARSLIFGTMAKPEILSQFPPEKIMVALDHRKGEVVDHGWQQSTGESIWDRAANLWQYCGSFLITFVETEGCLTGLPLEGLDSLKEKLKKPITVAGGIATVEEIVDISKMGLDVQVGMALYTGRIDPVEAVVGSINFDSNNLVPTVVRDPQGQVLMMAYSSPESLRLALKNGKGVFYSRSRKELWEKGATSGNRQKLLSCRVDCDRDCLMFTVQQENAACHNGTYSCFGQATSAREFSLPVLFDVLRDRKANLPEKSYSATLFKDRRKLMKKIMEEAHEVVSFTDKANLRWEIADLIYFLSVLAVDEDIQWAEIEDELSGRSK
jgi:phosphoribosyl-ATP pyrophosphohydrolase/phosphoribosyl-AMP cyclohydrolase